MDNSKRTTGIIITIILVIGFYLFMGYIGKGNITLDGMFGLEGIVILFMMLPVFIISYIMIYNKFIKTKSFSQFSTIVVAIPLGVLFCFIIYGIVNIIISLVGKAL